MPPTTTGEPKYLVTEAMIISRSWHRRQAPFFRVETVARVFFARSASWLRLKMATDAEHPDTWFTRDGKRMEFRRLNPEKAPSARVFTLADIEPMAYSLHRFGAIDSQRLMQILDIVQAMATLYGLFDEPPAGPGEDEGAENSALVAS
jgi:hypothetical protein